MPGIKRLLALIVAALLLLTPAAIAQGAPGGGPGKPPDTGNGGGGGGNPNKGPGNKLGDLYADLMVIARYVDGTPITVTYGGETCVQPITPASGHDIYDAEGNLVETVSFDPVVDTVDKDAYPYAPPMYYIPLIGEQLALLADEEDEDELEPCDVQAEFLGYVEEVDLGRLNLGRAPDRVLAKQLRDVEAFLSSGTIGLDASGRYTKLPFEDATLDSPLANMATYQSILETGAIGNTPIPDLTVGQPPYFDLTFSELTAAQFGAAAPKEAFTITVDTVQYLNRILGIPLQKKWDGVTTIPSETGETFLDFAGFSYDRAEMFPGCATYLVLNPDNTWFEETKPLSEVVPFTGSGSGTGIDGYAKLAEDARTVLVWTHDTELLVEVDFITQDDVCPEPTP